MINIPNTIKKDYKIKINGKISKLKKELIKEIVSITLNKEKIYNEELIIEIIISNEKEIKQINKEYLKNDKPTDIISIVNENNREIIETQKTILGTIFICPKIIKEKSIELNKNELQHLTHLMIHSTLHLLSYNHEKQDEIIKMKNKEITILSLLGITSPY